MNSLDALTEEALSAFKMPVGTQVCHSQQFDPQRALPRIVFEEDSYIVYSMTSLHPTPIQTRVLQNSKLQATQRP